MAVKNSITVAAKNSITITLACDEEKHEKLFVLSNESAPSGVTLRIDKVGLSANNKFYLSFGRNPTFQFFEAYPVPRNAQVVGEDTPPDTTSLVHPPAWGLATVVESSLPEAIPVGTKYRAMLPLGNQVQLEEVTPKENGDFLVVRPKTNPAYNVFAKVAPDSILASPDNTLAGVALATWPGTVTGFGLYYQLVLDKFYRKSPEEERVVVLTSASSKVSLATAFYLKQPLEQASKDIKVIGMTSESNKDFCQKTQLYDQVLGYDDDLPDDDKYILIDVAGRGEVYKGNQDKIVKAYVVGNSHGVPDAVSTFSSFGYIATLKMMLAFMGWGGWLAKYLNPKLEVFLIMTVSAQLTQDWGAEGFQKRYETAMQDFTKAAVDKGWMTCKQCNDMKEIKDAYQGIVEGTIPPNEAVILNVGNAVADLA